MTKCLGTPEQLVVYPLRGQCSPFCGGVRSSVAVHWILCVLFVLVAIRLLFFKIWIISAAALFSAAVSHQVGKSLIVIKLSNG
jgi:hypothetical protein